ncbi:hypothetical protein FRC07_012985, partial [Ceratobasidium sp. 392]
MDFQNNCLGLYNEYHGQGEYYADDAPLATLVEPSVTSGFGDDYTLAEGPAIPPPDITSSNLNSLPLNYTHNAHPLPHPQAAESALSSTQYASAEFAHDTQHYVNNTAVPEGFGVQSYVAVEQDVPRPLHFGPASYSYENIHGTSSQTFAGSVDLGASSAYVAPNELPPNAYVANPGFANSALPQFHTYNSSETLTSQPVLEAQSY